MAKPERQRAAQGVARADLDEVASNLARRADERAAADELARLRTLLERERQELAELRLGLEIERERFGDLLDFGLVAYVFVDDTGIIWSANLAAERLLERDRLKLVGMPLFADLVGTDRRRLLDQFRQCRTSAGLVTLDLELPRRGGGTMPIQLLSKRLGIGDGPATILCALIDMTEREEALAARRESELERQRAEHARDLVRAENAAKDRFLAVLSHELRNPLSPILFTVETLERGLLPPDRLAGALALIRRNLDVEVRLIDDLLDVSRIVHGKLTLERQLVDVHDVVRDVVEGSATDLRRAEVCVTLHLEATRHWVDGDPARLRQVVWNLLSNAIRNTPPEGSIVLATLDAPGGLALTVCDTGRGVAAHRLATIFEPFDQVDPPGRRRGGLGLGLAICRGLVEAHGGTVSANSEGPERGATFTVILPAVGSLARPAADPVPASDPPTRRLRVLVVEDDLDVAEAMTTVLELRGHDVTLAHSVAEALACAHAAFDVLVSDIGLPDGTGLDVMTALRLRNEVRGVAISGFGTPEDVQASVARGFERHLTKPVHLDELIDVIERPGR